MLTQEQHERLTQVGAGTPMGELLRRYWHPIAAAADLDHDPVRPVRLLGENLTLFRSAPTPTPPPTACPEPAEGLGEGLGWGP